MVQWGRSAEYDKLQNNNQQGLMDEWFWEMRKLEEPKMIYDVKLHSWGKCGISEEERILEGRACCAMCSSTFSWLQGRQLSLPAILCGISVLRLGLQDAGVTSTEPGRP